MFHRHNYTHIWLSVAILCLWAASPQGVREQVQPRGNDDAGGEERVDAGLQSAADSALAGREGTIIIMDAQTGRLRAVVNPRRAYEEALPPGSTIKPFTALAALRAGSIDSESNLSCREPYRRGDFKINCSHPLPQPPFNLPEALAHSCNYFFSNVSEGLDAEKFNPTLASFGFGARIGIGGDGEADVLRRGAFVRSLPVTRESDEPPVGRTKVVERRGGAGLAEHELRQRIETRLRGSAVRHRAAHAL